MKRKNIGERGKIDIPQMPFDDALRAILKAPHQAPAKRKKSKRALSKRTK